MTIPASIRVVGVLSLWAMSHWSYGQHYQAKGDDAFPTTKIHFNLVNDDQPLQDAEMDETKELAGASFIPHQTPTPAEPHFIEVAESMRAYEDGRYADAALAVAIVAQLEPADPTVLNCYARALYRQGEDGRQRSHPVYQRLIKLLDRYGREDRFSVAVYTLFLEAYFKLATLQLDNRQWAAATYNLSRTALALSSIQDFAANQQGIREQILQYQTECFARLDNPVLCRYFGQRTIKFFPHNQYVLPYLAKLKGPSKNRLEQQP